MKVKNLIKELQKLDPNADVSAYGASIFQYNSKHKLKAEPTQFIETEWSDGTRHWERKELVMKERPNRRGIVSGRKLLTKEKTIYLVG